MSKILTSSKKRSAFFVSSIVKMCAIAGIAAVAVSAQTDLARGKTATASSTEGSYIASNAVDGNSGTRWASLFIDNQSITIDLGAIYSINSVRLSWETASARDYQIEISPNGNDPWTPVAYKSNMPAGNNRTDDITGLSASSRYIRMYGTARTTQWGFSLYSFEVYGGGSTHYTLSTSASPAGTGTVSLNPAGGSYAAGTSVTVTASAASGYQFSSWSGALSGTANPATIAMNGNYSVVANFTPVSSGYQAGDMSYYNGSTWLRIPSGTAGQVLTENGSQVPTWTNLPGFVTDTDGNLYRTVIIGDQEWTLTNLKTTKFNDGTPIPNVTDNSAWNTLTTSGYCWYNNSRAASEKCGALYNWYVVSSGKLAPAGWRVPTASDWAELEYYLIGIGYNWDGTTTGNKIAKSLATGGWQYSSTPGAVGYDPGTNNKSGFSAQPGGYRNFFGVFTDWAQGANWWSATEYDQSYAWGSFLYHQYASFGRGQTGFGYKNCGFSVRLVRNID